MRVVPIALLCLAALPGTAGAQAASPSIFGRVVDETGTALPGVAVQATSTDRRTSQTVVTDQNGRYTLAGLPEGRYGVTFSLTNFADARRPNITVSPSAPAEIDVTRSLALNATVVVTGRATFRNLADLAHPEASLVGVAAAASEGAVTAKQIEARPIMRAGEVLEAVPGVIISQHSGEGKANQYYLRGFNLDHGTDFAATVAGVPVNLPTHAHGQGYLDLSFLIPELVTGVQFRKGPYFAQDGDFAAAGSANVNYANVLAHSIVSASAGQDGWSRLLLAASPRVGTGTLLAARVFRERASAIFRKPPARRRRQRAVGSHEPGQWSGRVSPVGSDARRARRVQPARSESQRHRVLLHIATARRAGRRAERHSYASGAATHRAPGVPRPVLGLPPPAYMGWHKQWPHAHRDPRSLFLIVQCCPMRPLLLVQIQHETTLQVSSGADHCCGSMEDEVRRAILEAAYSRIRERLQAKDVTAEHLRNAALEALARACVQMELDPAWVEEELNRLQGEPEPEPDPD